VNQTDIRSYRRALRRFERVTNHQLKNCCSGVTLAQCLVLMEIDESDRLTTSGLASRLRLDNSTLSRTIDGLVKQEQLERRRDDEDRRVVWLRLTRKGRATCRSLHKENDAICRRVMEKIPPSRRDTVLRSFETLVQAYLDCEQET
jgi:DNA-binding MarR family transcriptional regulator